MSDPARVLCVGDTLEPMLQATGRPSEAFTVTSLPTPERGLSYLSEHDIDCLVSDLEPADSAAMDGIDFCRTLRKRGSTVPYVLVVGPDDRARTSEAIAAGVTDLHVTSGDVDQGELLATRLEIVLARDGGDSDDAATADDRARDRADAARTAEPDRDPAGHEAGDEFDPERYRTVLDQVADPMYVLDETGVCTVANEALVEYTGYERGEMEGHPVEAFVDEEDYDDATETIETLYGRTDTDRDAFEVTIRAADGEPRIGEAHVTIVVDDDGSYAGSVGVIRDITERKERIRELGRYETIVETAPIGLVSLDENGFIRWHNDEFTTDLGIDEPELIGTPFGDLTEAGYFPAETMDDYRERVRNLLSSETDDQRLFYEEEWVRTDGERGITEVNMGLLPLEDGEFAGTVHAFRNVTERVQYQQELERQNERLERFATLVSHDLRNPLNVAQGYLDLLEAECESHAVEETRWAVDRMEELIDDLLALARYGRTVADRERIDLDELARIAWAGVDTAEATLEVDLDGAITAHESRVRELFENLFRNAIEHGGASVTVTIGQVAAADDGDASAGFFVEDDGDGLPDTESIFEFGHSTTADGTGFGLGIVSEIADAHGWTVTATDGREGGARFEITEVTLLEEGPITG